MLLCNHFIQWELFLGRDSVAHRLAQFITKLTTCLGNTEVTDIIKFIIMFKPDVCVCVLSGPKVGIQ